MLFSPDGAHEGLPTGEERLKRKAGGSPRRQGIAGHPQAVADALKAR